VRTGVQADQAGSDNSKSIDAPVAERMRKKRATASADDGTTVRNRPARRVGTGGTVMKRFAAAALVFALTAASVRAQEEKKANEERVRQLIDAGLSRMVDGVAVRYDLEDAQKEQLRALMKERAEDFLKTHGEAIRKLAETEGPALQEKIKAGGLRSEDVKALREKVTPLLEAARKHLSQSADLMSKNILDADQRTKFGEDRDRMEKQLDDALSRLNSGEFDQIGALMAGRMAGRLGGGDFGPGGGRSFTGRGFEERRWDTWLRSLGLRGKMTDEQKQRAQSLLVQAKEAAALYRKEKEEDYKKIAADLAELRTNKDADPKRREGIEKAGRDLGRPIEEIGLKWMKDVWALLNDEQKKAAETLDPAKQNK